MRFFLIVIYLFFVKSIAKSQVEPNLRDSLALKIGTKAFTNKQLAFAYKKAKETDTIANDGFEPFLESFIKKQLIVLKAEKDGKTNQINFKEEVATIRQELANQFLEDKESKDALIKEAYNRMAEEINVSHILINLNENASPSDTLEAYNRAYSLKLRAEKGESFEELARVHSDDNSVYQNKGNLGYITSFYTLYDFENAAYSLKNGEISKPTRTKYGYHIIKVNGRRAFQRWKVAHIFTEAGPGDNEQKSIAAKQKIDAAYLELKSGKNFEELCKKYSEDATTASKGGVFRRMFGSDELEKSFEDAISNLKPGEYTTVTKTSKGWHIIKLLDKQGLKNYDAMYNFLQQKVLADSRNEKLEIAIVENLKNKLNFTSAEDTKYLVLKAIDSLLITNNKLESDALGIKNLFTIGNRTIRASQFFDYINKVEKPNNKNFQTGLSNKWLTNFTRKEIKEYAIQNLEINNEEFAFQINDYKENILVHDMYEKNIWEPVFEDTLRQRKYYLNNITKYKFTESADVEVIDAVNLAALNYANNIFSKSPYPVSIKWRDILFEKNKTEINEVSKKNLINLVSLLAKNTDYQIHIGGHIDPEETEGVSSERVNAVDDFLEKNNIDPARIIVKDEGKFKPVSKTNRALNSRVSFQIFTTSKEDIAKLYNILKPNALKIKQFTASKNDKNLPENIKWQTGVQTVNSANRVQQINIKKILPAGERTLDDCRGRVIKDIQTELENNMYFSLKNEFKLEKNEIELAKLK